MSKDFVEERIERKKKKAEAVRKMTFAESVEMFKNSYTELEVNETIKEIEAKTQEIQAQQSDNSVGDNSVNDNENSVGVLKSNTNDNSLISNNSLTNNSPTNNTLTISVSNALCDDDREINDFLINSPDYLSGDPDKRKIFSPFVLNSDINKDSVECLPYADKLKLFKEVNQQAKNERMHEVSAISFVERNKLKGVEHQILDIVDEQAETHLLMMRKEHEEMLALEEAHPVSENSNEVTQVSEDSEINKLNQCNRKSIDAVREEWRKEDFKNFNLNHSDFLLVTDTCSSRYQNFKKSSIKRKTLSFMERLFTLGCLYGDQRELINTRVIVLQTEKDVTEEICIDTENIKVTLIDNRVITY